MRKEESTLTINKNGDKFWRNKEGKLHRIDGPAVEYGNGAKHWYQNGVLHRTKEAFFEALTDEEKYIALFSEDFLNA